MTTAFAAKDDPYVLDMPAPDSPVVQARWVSTGNRHANSAFADMVWPLGPLIDNPGAIRHAVQWKDCPECLRAQLKPIVWTMINGALRPTQVQNRGTRARTRRSPAEMHTTAVEWMRLARWLDEHRIRDFADCTPREWQAYVAERWSGGCSRRTAEKTLGRLTDLWAFDQLSARPAGIVRPPWDSEGADDFLPAESDAAGRGENSTEPLDPQVLGPLLTWAIRMVEDFADDILAAWAENRRLTDLAATTKPSPAGRAALENYLLPLVDNGSPLPSTENRGKVSLARTYIAATTGASPSQLDLLARPRGIDKLVAERPGPAPLRIPVTGRIDGRPWREHLDFTEAADLMRHLGTAAAITCLYLTGMRPQEVQGLRSGCCPDPEPTSNGSPGRHLIRSHHYKNVSDDDGNHLSAGEERAVPWVAITPVVRAIRVLERMVPEGELLLSAAHHDIPRQRNNPGALKNFALRWRIESFVAWANREAHAQGLPEQAIPDDPHGKIGLARFRRSLAWHIARRPGGLIALAIQYGHMRTFLDARTSTGYGTRSRGGIHSELDIETVLAAADTAAQLNDRMAVGEKVSGPAARRALTAAATTPRFEGKIVTSKFATKAAAFLARDGLVLFDNPDAHLICVFKRDTALCDPDPNAVAPNQFACQLGCGNAVRTDTHAAGLRERARELEALAAAAPGPVGRRLERNADRLREVADHHDATAEPAEALT